MDKGYAGVILEVEGGVDVGVVVAAELEMSFKCILVSAQLVY